MNTSTSEPASAGSDRSGDDINVHDLDVDMAIAQNIRREREYIGLSQEDVARVLSIPRAAVSAIEHGKRRVSSSELRKLAHLFSTTTDSLVGIQTPEDSTVEALFRATKSLTEHDKQQVLRFAEFLRQAGSAPAPPPGTT